MQLSTGQINQNHKIIGIVTASASDGLHPGRDIMATFKSFIGGPISGYEKAINNITQKALEKLRKQAQELGCDGVEFIRHDYFAVELKGQPILFVAVHGTAILLSQEKHPINPIQVAHTDQKKPAQSPISEGLRKTPIKTFMNHKGGISK